MSSGLSVMLLVKKLSLFPLSSLAVTHPMVSG